MEQHENVIRIGDIEPEAWKLLAVGWLLKHSESEILINLSYKILERINEILYTSSLI